MGKGESDEGCEEDKRSQAQVYMQKMEKDEDSGSRRFSGTEIPPVIDRMSGTGVCHRTRPSGSE